MASKGIPPVCALIGTEPTLIKEKLQEMLVHAGVQADDTLDFSEYDAGDANGSSIQTSAVTSPFLSERRTVVVRRAERLSDATNLGLTELVPNLPAWALLILVFESGETLDDSQKQLLKAIKANGAIVECSAPKSALVAKELEARATSQGYRLGSRAAERIVHLVDGEFGDALMELEKLMAYRVEEKAITELDVDFIVTASPGWRVFEMLDSVVQGDLGRALTNWHLLLSSSGKVSEVTFPTLFPQLSRQLRLLWQVVACRQANVSATSSSAAKFCPDKHNWPAFASKSDWVAKKTARLASRMDLHQIGRMMTALVEADMRLKGQLPASSPEESVERMLAEMCDIAACRPAR